jgi:uncharacterized protein YbaA (DUF1428 family)
MLREIGEGKPDQAARLDNGCPVAKHNYLVKYRRKQGSMAYVDGFVIPISKKNVEAYRRIARKAGKIWMKHGALSYVECAGDDINVKFGQPFPKGARTKAGETVLFSFITFKSRAHRDKVNAKVMADPAMQEPLDCPFDPKRMMYGGFKTLVNL